MRGKTGAARIALARVMAPLFDALAAAGVPVAFRGRPGHLPIAVGGVGFPGGRFDLPGDVSSQFATALMAAAPFGAAPTEIRMTRPVHSAAYLAQTAAALAFEIACEEMNASSTPSRRVAWVDSSGVSTRHSMTSSSTNENTSITQAMAAAPA